MTCSDKSGKCSECGQASKPLTVSEFEQLEDNLDFLDRYLLDYHVMLTQREALYRSYPGNPFLVFMLAYREWRINSVKWRGWRTEQIGTTGGVKANPVLDRELLTKSRTLIEVINHLPVAPLTLRQRIKGWLRWGKGPKTVS